MNSWRGNRSALLRKGVRRLCHSKLVCIYFGQNSVLMNGLARHTFLECTQSYFTIYLWFRGRFRIRKPSIKYRKPVTDKKRSSQEIQNIRHWIGLNIEQPVCAMQDGTQWCGECGLERKCPLLESIIRSEKRMTHCSSNIHSFGESNAECQDAKTINWQW